MAANLQGMLTQINEAMSGMAPAQGNAMVPGMAPRPQDTINPMLQQGIQGLSGAFGEATGIDMGDNRTSQQAYGQAMKAMESLPLDTSAGLTQAAQLYQQLGMQEQALAMLERAEQIKKAENAKNNNLLEVHGQAATEEAQRKRASATKAQAMQLAKQKGDEDALAALRAGALSGEEYLKAKANEKRETAALAEGSILVDKEEGIVIATNPKSNVPGAEYKMTGPDKTAMYKSQEAWQKHDERSTQAQSVADSIKAVPAGDLKAGAYATTSDWIAGVTGQRDKAQQLRTQYLNLQKSGIVQAMPSGPQSDNDVRIFSRGFPPENAGKDEIVAFLEAQSRIAQYAADYEEMKIDHIVSGTQGELIDNWRRHLEVKGKEERIQMTPQPAVQDLMTSQQSYLRMKDAFAAKYGWLPEPDPTWSK